MRNFFLGVIVTLVLLAVGGIGIALLGFIPTNANATPPHIERQIAMTAQASLLNSPGMRATPVYTSMISIWLGRTTFGRAVYAIGNRERAGLD